LQPFQRFLPALGVAENDKETFFLIHSLVKNLFHKINGVMH
jgi:hypothetical protein